MGVELVPTAGLVNKALDEEAPVAEAGGGATVSCPAADGREWFPVCAVASPAIRRSNRRADRLVRETMVLRQQTITVLDQRFNLRHNSGGIDSVLGEQFLGFA